MVSSLFKFISVFISLAVLTKSNPTKFNEKPNVIFILADDIGFADFSYNSEIGDIQTPSVDKLADSGIRLTNYYVHSLCTPTRASLLTGRYSVNTGLTSVLVQGTPAGLPPDVSTLPELLLKHDYSTVMVGKWHLGHATHQQTPTGRGFESFIGIYMWDVDSYTKQNYEEPWLGPQFIDWTSEYSNGTFINYAEPRHATLAITEEAQSVILQHDQSKPLFLYVPFTASHSPLQPMPEHEPSCAHIPHEWRRKFCGMTVGLDEGIKNITMTALHTLGPNTIIIVSSDNGGSPWFGGQNFPLRGSKTTPFEGGVKVPGFVVELSAFEPITHSTQTFEQLIPIQKGREFNSLFHVSDWLPTIASLASISVNDWPNKLDGIDQSNNLPLLIEKTSDNENRNTELRTEVLLELYRAEDSPFNVDLFSYRINDMKLIQGVVRDSNWYYSSNQDYINSSAIHSTPSSKFYWKYYLSTKIGETIIRFLSNFFDEGAYDTMRILLTHTALHRYYSELPPVDNNHNIIQYIDKTSKRESSHYVWLFNLTSDPTEQNNLAN